MNFHDLYRDALNAAHDAGWRADLGESFAATYAQMHDGRPDTALTMTESMQAFRRGLEGAA